MSHSFHAKNGTNFFFNPDLSGDTHMVDDNDLGIDAHVNGKDLLEFIRMYLEVYAHELGPSSEDLSVSSDKSTKP